MMHVLCLFVILAASANARVANDIDISENLIEKEPFKDHGKHYQNVKQQETNTTRKKQSEIKDFVDNNETVNTLTNNNNSTNTNKTMLKLKDLTEADVNENLIDTGETVKDVNDNLIDTGETVKEVLDNGTALILTPLIESGRLDEARNYSKVNPELLLHIESYSGFFTVNKTYNSNVFFWYFPVIEKPVNETPWIIWLQGGPGASSLMGLFEEIGPFTVNKDGVLKKNPHTWHTNHSLLFIDNPIGTGYSFTDSKDGFVKDMATYSHHLYTTVVQFLLLFPELRTAPLYICGESYAGKYVPALAMELHKHKTSSNLEINLQGIIIGNGYEQASMLSSLPQSFYNFGLLQTEQLEQIKPIIDNFNKKIEANKSTEAKEKWVQIINIVLLMTNQKHAYNFLKDSYYNLHYMRFLNEAEIKKAIHVGDIEFNFINVTTNLQMGPDFISSVKHLYESLLENYRVLTYCGQLDQMISCVTSFEHHRKWQWSGDKMFLNATRLPYIYKNKMVGYYKSGGGFTEVLVRGAGHMVPIDTPDPIRDIITRWIHCQPLEIMKEPTVLTVHKRINLKDILNNISSVLQNDIFSDISNDNDSALILTPLIESGRIDEARNSSKVIPELFLGIESYSGFFTVNKMYNSNIFFWYFPVQERPVNETPWIIWLQGGPGASSLTGLFDEIGPFKVDKDGVLQKNPHTWHSNHSMVFIDNPIGSGYSFTDNQEGFVKDMDTYTKHLYSTVEQFLQLFPELRAVPLYICGESYAGKYVPALAMELHKHKTSSNFEVNLEGVIIGNGYEELSMLSSLPKASYNFGLIQEEQLENIKTKLNIVDDEIVYNNSIETIDKWSEYYDALLSMTKLDHPYNFLKDTYVYEHYKTFLDKPEVKKALHVGRIEFNYHNETTKSNIRTDFLISSKQLYENLLENYKVLTYCGQLDQLISCVTSFEHHRKWRWSSVEQFKNATRLPYFINNKVIGYYKSGGGFTEVMVKGAGHMVPMDTPEAIKNIVVSWTHNEPMSKMLLMKRFLNDYIRNNTKSIDKEDIIIL